MKLERVWGSFCGLKYIRFKFIFNFIENEGIFKGFFFPSTWVTEPEQQNIRE